MSFDLENLDKEIKSGPTKEAAPTDGIAGGLAKLTAGASLDDIFDRFQKFVFVFDISGSMGEGMMPGEIDQVAVWTDDLLGRLRSALTEYAKRQINNSPYLLAQARESFAQAIHTLEGEIESAKESITELQEALKEGGLDPEEREEINEEIEALKETIEDISTRQIPEAMSPTPEAVEAAAIKQALGFDLADTQALKLQTYLRKLDSAVGVPVMRTGLGLSSIGKLDVVKTSAKGFITQRLDKYPNADIVVIEFDDKVKIVSKKSTREQLLTRIDSMYPQGGTDIFLAVSTAVEECKKRPANVGANHIVLVTDGDSPTVDRLVTLVSIMKEKGIVLDFIFIKSTQGYMTERLKMYGYIEQITAISKETNGQVIEVDNAQALSKKFFEVSSRKCLPPAPDSK